MHHLGRNIALITVIILICLWSIFPVEKNLRLGKDLAGGVSLIYTIDIDPNDSGDVIDRTIEVLKDRLDPRGLYELSMNQIGRDRIEVSFPLPNDRVKALRAAFEAELLNIEQYRIDPDSLQRVLRLKGNARTDALIEMAGDSDARRQILQPLIDASAEVARARAAYDSARDSGAADPGQIDALASAAADAEIKLDETTSNMGSAVISADEVREALELPSEPMRITDKANKTVVDMPSERERTVGRIRERIASLPGATEVFDAIEAKHAEYALERTGFDDPNQVVRQLQGAGVLDFRIAVSPGTSTEEARMRRELQEKGPDFAQSGATRWYRINKIENWFDDLAGYNALIANPSGYFGSNYRLVGEEYGGQYYVLLHDEASLRLTGADGNWAASNATQGVDQLGRPSVNFRMNAVGANLLRDLTGPNVGRNMAVLLDSEVYTAPNINSELSTSVMIMGNFTSAQINYLIKTLNAGSLQAKLGERPISQNVLAPSLGRDNLLKGLTASWIALIAVCVFMVFYYFSQGFIAMLALATNAVIILGAMSLARASFTLPGIAGIVLTFGMAVDANVLIYERLREEIFAGNDLRTAVRLAYQKVFSTIIDANITNLIVCFVLAYTATPEVKGFAITLGIGIVATLFSSLIVTRVIFALLLDVVKVRKMRQLPIVIPAIDRILTPKLDFVGLRPLFWVISTILVGAGISLVVSQGNNMLGTEFRGGTEISLQLTDDVPKMTRAQVEERVRQVVAEADERLAQNPEDAEAQLLSQLTDAGVVAVNPEADGLTSNIFKVTTTIAEDPDTELPEQTVLRDAVVAKFEDVVDSRPALEFRGSDALESSGAPLFQVIEPSLGANVGQSDFGNDIERYVGGLVILLEDFAEPRPSKADLVDRLEYMRSQPDFASMLRRQNEVIVLEGTDDAVQTAAVVSIDPVVSFFVDEERWRTEVAEGEWRLVRSALTESTTLAGVQSFSAAIAATFKAQAIVAVSLSFLLILGYIWFRFGSIRYSLAAITALVHDVIAALGLIALATILYDAVPDVAKIGIRPFKIDLGLIAAILTIIGYSLNDTIVILDRIRENRGKLAYASRDVINTAISQTLSRTLITSGTTLVALIVMFSVGGEGIASFTYALICGVIVGTYSSIAVAAPLVYTRNIPTAGARYHTPDPEDDEMSSSPQRAST